VRARLPADRAYRVGEPVGLALKGERLSLFDCRSGRAIPSAL